VAEAFGTACAAAGDTDRAIEWYEKALTAEDGGTSIRVPEQLGDLRARRAWEQVEAVYGQGNKNVLDKALSAARASLVEALKILDDLVALKPTIERQSLCGSTYKRLAMVERLAGNSKAELSAIDKMALHYGEAEKLAHASHDANLFYPVLNRMAAQLIARHGKAGWPGFLAEDIAMVRQSLERKIQDDPDFWSVAGLLDLEMYRALAAGNLADCLDTIRAAYEDIHHRMTEEWMWKSVRDQAAFVLYHYPSRGQENPEGRAVAELLDLLDRFAGCCR
jgi:tetratricopeptide (TPR) repeat protein